MEKASYVRMYLEGRGSQQQCADAAGVSKTAFQHWLRSYRAFGARAFQETSNRHYPEQLKEAAVKEYLEGNSSQEEICRKYQITSIALLYKWIRQAQGRDKEPAPKRKGRATSYEERLQIVEWCLAHNRDYAGTAEHFQVSYQQVYTWVRRFDVGEPEHLKFTKEKK